MTRAYYNEIEPYAAEWLRNLIKQGLIADGEVDERSIVDVSADDLVGFTQCHFFAGIGGWSAALRLAGWPDDREIWTGSCPCQPFSVAGKGLGADDPRHLWPHYHRLIAARRPAVVMGEQVAGAAGYGWLDGVRADLAREGYASRGVDIPACAVDAPHIRSRLYWVASALVNDDVPGREHGREGDARQGLDGEGQPDHRAASAAGRISGYVGHADGARSEARIPAPRGRHEGLAEEPDDGGRGSHGAGGERPAFGGGDMADAGRAKRRPQPEERRDDYDRSDAGWQEATSGHQLDRTANSTFWSDAIWLTGADGKSRRAQPGIPLLAHGIPSRVGRLRAYGNAIVPQLASEVIAAFMDARP